VNILLINPVFPDTFWSFSHALKFIRKKAAYPPLGLLTVSAMLPKHWSRRLVDLNVAAIDERDLKWADMAFVTGMAIQRKSVNTIIQRCRKAGLKIVAGGPLFSAEPEHFADVDHLVLGEAEQSIGRFVRDLAHGRAEPIYRQNSFCDLRNTPLPEWQLINTRKYAAMSIQCSRGCPFNCDFCNVTALFGHRPRFKAPEQVTAELDAIYRTGWRGNIFFVDDNFIGNRRYLKSELLPALIRWREGKRGCVFFTEASIDLADDVDLMDMMVKAGFDSVFIGIESPDEACLTECRKTQNRNRDLLENVKIIQRAGLQVLGGFIVGFDNDRPSIFQRQVDFIQQSGIVTAMVGMLQAPPGTRLFDRLQKENRLRGFLSGDNVDGTTNIIPQMGVERLIAGYRLVMSQLYAPKNYYHRTKIFLKECKAPDIQVPMTMQRVFAAMLTSFRIGILAKERLLYWELLLWTLLRRPKLLPMALTFTIYGYHFRKICEQYIL
jgi:radical SAM superfamily enzyme YgiQ (UPF0313 family)